MNILKNIPAKIENEYSVFLSYPRDMRVLLVTNIIYALILPITDIFVSDYIMHNSNDPTMVANLSVMSVYRNHNYVYDKWFSVI